MRKRFWAVAAVFLSSTLIGFAGAPQEAAACSGDNCDCGIWAAVCHEGCPPYDEPGGQECFAGCRQESVRCAIACCSGGWDRPAV